MMLKAVHPFVHGFAYIVYLSVLRHQSPPHVEAVDQ